MRKGKLGFGISETTQSTDKKLIRFVSDRKDPKNSQVRGKQLARIGSLPFNFSFGACSVTRGQLLMCFGERQVRKCRLTESLENFQEIMSTQYDHRGVRMATDDLERTFGMF